LHADFANPLQAGGAVGVDIFFLISGYILTKKWIRGDYRSYGSYMIKRIFRTWPMYYVGVLMYVLLGFATLSVPLLFFASNYFPQTFAQIGLWTLMIEELFYLTLPTLLWLGFFRKNWKIALITMLEASLFYRYFVVHFLSVQFNTSVVYLNGQILSFLFLYSMGIILGMGKSLQFGRYRFVIPIAFCLMVLATGDVIQTWWSPFIVAIMGYLIIANYEKSRFFTNRISVFYGKISYSFYLFSVLVGPLVVVFNRIFGGSLVNEPILTVAWLLTTIIAITLLSYLAYTQIERRFILFGRKLIYAEQTD
jgi:peptidoglycan/LPS O-acetylase OafA/YrhL